MYRLLLIMAICLAALGAQGQQTYVYGYVKDSVTDLPVEDVHIWVNRTDSSDYTNGSGLFVLNAGVSDSVTLVRVGYFPLTVALADHVERDTVRITLVPKTHELESVMVSSYSYADYQADSADRRKYFGEAIGYSKPLLDNSTSGAGLGISLDRIFSRRQRSQKRAFKLFKEVERDKYVDFRFNSILVHSYTGFRGEELQRFMRLYRPSYDWLRSHTRQVDLLYYINDKLKKFK